MTIVRHVRLQDKDGNRPYDWYTKKVGGYILLCFDYYVMTPLSHFPVHRETIIGRIRNE